MLDEETQKTFPGLAHRSRPPGREELRQAMARLRQAIRSSKARGARTVFYFYYAGHGDVGQDREGIINLLDGRFSRSDLYREVISQSPADQNHIIIDACNSYFLVNRRGDRSGRASHAEALRSFLAEESLDRYPNTGVLLSTASMNETHEWSRFRSGIFSHQLLSAMAGGADVDNDRVVEYREVAAYMAAANLRVRDSRARLSIFARPPRSDMDAALIDLRSARRVGPGATRPASGRVAAILHVPRDLEGHYHLEDDRGVRYLDFNKTAEQPLAVALIDRPYYYLRSRDREAMIRLEGGGDVQVAELTFIDLPTRSRGSVEESFRRDLYVFPFGRSFAMGHATAVTSGDEPDLAALVAQDPRPRRSWYSQAGTWKWISAGAALTALGVGITMQVLAVKSADELRDGGEMAIARALELQDESNTRRAFAGVAFGIAGTAALTSAVLFLVDRGGSGESARALGSVGVAHLPDGGLLSLSGSF